jgi:hypothetical protein
MAPQLRADYQKLATHMKAWEKFQRERPGVLIHSTVDRLSGIFASFVSEEALIINRMRFSKKYEMGIDGAMSGLRVFKGSPMWPIDHACYQKVLRKKMKGKSDFDNLRLLADDIGALCYIGEEYQFDKEKAERVYEEHITQLRLRQHQEGGSGNDPSRDEGKAQGSDGHSNNETERRVDDKPANLPGNA